MRTPDQYMAPAGRDSLEREQGEIAWSSFGMLAGTGSHYYLLICAFTPQFETYTVLVGKLNKKMSFVYVEKQSLKL